MPGTQTSMVTPGLLWPCMALSAACHGLNRDFQSNINLKNIKAEKELRISQSLKFAKYMFSVQKTNGLLPIRRGLYQYGTYF
jgi:hypothetical protein